MLTKFQKKAMGEDTNFGRALDEVTGFLEGMIGPEDLLQRAILDEMEDLLFELEWSRESIESARRNMNNDLSRLDNRREGDSLTTGSFPFTYSWGSHLERVVAKHEAGLAEFFRIYRIGRAAGMWGKR